MSQIQFLFDQQIDAHGLLMEIQAGCLLSKCMQDPPHNMQWPRLIADVAQDAHYSASAQGTWRKMREYSTLNGGGSIVAMDEEMQIPVGYAHCMVLTEQGIQDFRLNDAGLSVHAAPGDLLLTFAGLAPQYRGARLADDGKTLIFAPIGGWESGTKKPGTGLYQMLYQLRMENWGKGKRCWNRTHPERDTVRFTGGKYGLKPRGTITVLQAGIETPKVILCTDGPYDGT